MKDFGNFTDQMSSMSSFLFKSAFLTINSILRRGFPGIEPSFTEGVLSRALFAMRLGSDYDKDEVSRFFSTLEKLPEDSKVHNMPESIRLFSLAEDLQRNLGRYVKFMSKVGVKVTWGTQWLTRANRYTILVEIFLVIATVLASILSKLIGFIHL